MSDHDHDTVHDDESIHPLSRKLMFLGDHKFIDNFIWLIIVGLAVTTVLGLVYPFDPSHKAPWDFFASWSIIGFLAYSFVVLSAEPLFKLLARREDYYDEGGEDD